MGLNGWGSVGWLEGAVLVGLSGASARLLVASRCRAALLAGCAFASLALGVALEPRPAAAQFVCGGSADGSEPQTGAGGFGGGSTGNFACGSNASSMGARPPILRLGTIRTPTGI